MRLSRLKFLILILLFSGAAFAGGWYFGHRGFEAWVSKNPPKIQIVNRAPLKQTADFALFWQVWDLLEQKYLFQPLDPQKLLYGALKGLTGAVDDPYTSFLTPGENEMMNASLSGEYEGIGAELGIRNDKLLIIAPLEGSPAQTAGVRAGDEIVKIGGEETVGIGLSEAVVKIRGEAGTSIVLTLKRGSTESQTLDISITRAQITVPSVKWEDKGDGVLYIRLSRFGEDTSGEWQKIVAQVVHRGSLGEAVVLDVRGNPGGYLNAAAYIASEFVRGGSIVIEDFGEGRQKTFYDEVNNSFSNQKVVVLIDGGSASASEIVAAALRERRGAVLVGQTSFGKGTVQDAAELPGGSGVHITVAKWLTPNGGWVNEKGLTPDVIVERTEEDLNSGRDPQLQKALELARGN